jgi:GNAT superfamily N-acetyltransferase
MMPALRPAVASDALAGAALQRACWREAYGPYVDGALLEARVGNEQPWIDAWVRQLAVGPPRVVAEVDGELVGFAVAGPSRDEEPVAADELYAIYTRAAWWGTGLGRLLWEAVRPAGSCSLWVLEANVRARAFYERHGFVADGARELYADLDTWEIRMVRT